MSDPASTTKKYNIPETPEESIYHSASVADKYANNLMDEITPLINQMEINYPKEAARFTSLIFSLTSMTEITKNRAEKLFHQKSSISLSKDGTTLNSEME